jgi:hypothetical protein
VSDPTFTKRSRVQYRHCHSRQQTSSSISILRLDDKLSPREGRTKEADKAQPKRNHRSGKTPTDKPAHTGVVRHTHHRHAFGNNLQAFDSTENSGSTKPVHACSQSTMARTSSDTETNKVRSFRSTDPLSTCPLPVRLQHSKPGSYTIPQRRRLAEFTDAREQKT